MVIFGFPMQHIRDVKNPDKENSLLTVDTPEGDLIVPPLMRDRSLPAWAKPLSLFFTIGSQTCVVALILLTAFFQSMVATQGQALMAPILVLLGTVPIVGLLIFEFGYAKALAGYRGFRRRNAVIMRAITGLFVAAIMVVLHPLLIIPFAIGAILCWAIVRLGGSLAAREPSWDFLPQEAVSVLAGRDQVGLDLSWKAQNEHSLIKTGLRGVSWLAFTCAFGCATWLTAKGILNINAIIAVGLLSFWSVEHFGAYLSQRSNFDPAQNNQAVSVKGLPIPEDIDPDQEGVQIRNLSAVKTDGQSLLTNVHLDFEPGKIIALTGDSFSGKSLLMRALVGPQDLANIEVRGCVRIGGHDPWQTELSDKNLTAAYLPPRPRAMPGSGMQNLSCFSSDHDRMLIEQMLTRFVYTSDISQHICDTSDVRLLSDTELKALGLARTFYLRPKLYLLDRPEDGASERLLTALATRIKQEQRFGAIFLIATNSRQLLELCDEMVVMQGGRVVDFGPAAEIRQQFSIGWSRFIAVRNQDSEDALDSWLRAQFRREGDDQNRRKVCVIANELLAFSCQNLSPADDEENLRFEFKLFEGYCILRLLDMDQPLSSGALERARVEMESHAEIKQLSPLAMVFRDALSVEARTESGMRVVEVKIETYDPRKHGQKAKNDRTRS